MRAAAAALLLALAVPARAEDETPRTPVTAHREGVKFLVAHQNPDGSFGTFHSTRTGEIWLGTVASLRSFGEATNALCALALVKPSRTDEQAKAALDKAVERLLAAAPVLRATGDTFYDTWTHLYQVEALARLAHDPRYRAKQGALMEALRREVDLLCSRQAADGGFGYYDFIAVARRPSGHESTSFLTGAVLLALSAANELGVKVEPAVIAGALACLERLRKPDGSYIYGTYLQRHPAHLANRDKGSLGRSQPCELALWTYGRKVTPQDVRAALVKLKDQHHFLAIGRGRPYPHEAWYYTAGYYVLFGRYYAARAVATLPPGEREELETWLAETTAKDQDRDGSWMDFPLYGWHRAYGTAFALLTLQALGADSPE